LVAKQGDERAHHFAHEVDPGIACSSHIALETALHKLAKQAIATHKTLMLPAVVATHGDRSREVSAARELLAEDVRIEEVLAGRRPDIIFIAGDVRLVVEVAVSNFASRTKQDVFRQADIPAIEIDLSDARELPPEELDEAILRSAPRRWLHNAEQEAAEALLRAEAEEAARSLRSASHVAPRNSEAPLSEQAAKLRQAAFEKLGEAEGEAWFKATIDGIGRDPDDIDFSGARAMLVNAVRNRRKPLSR